MSIELRSMIAASLLGHILFSAGREGSLIGCGESSAVGGLEHRDLFGTGLLGSC